MADSDDEYDRKRRDKFRGERSAGDNYRSERRDERRRDDWPERNPFRGRARPDYREYRGGRDRYSPGRDLPPPKRMRPEWGDEGRPRYGGHDGYGVYGWGHEHYSMHSGHGFGNHPPIPNPTRDTANNTDMQTQPPMLTLKQFLDTQDDGISDSEVLRKYSEYKVDFRRQQLNEFFVAHKDEEWFKNKYHPEESLKRKEEQLGFLMNRVQVFSDLLEQGSITEVTVDTNQTEPLLRLLDTAVIKLEGGTEEDLKVLYMKSPPHEFKPTRINDKDPDDDVIITEIKENDPKIGQTNVMAKEEEENWECFKVSPKKKSVKQQQDDDEENWDNSGDELMVSKPPETKKDDDDWDSEDDNTTSKKEETPARNRTDSESSESSTSARDHKQNEKEEKSEIITDTEKPEPIEEKVINENNDTEKEIVESSSVDEKKEEISDETKIKEEKENEEDEDETIGNGDKTEKDEDAKSDEQQQQEPETANPETIDLDKEKDPEIIEESGPRALHKTSSIFLRNLAPTITKDEIEAVCKRYNGFLRVAIADPLVERRWFRRGWVTFKRDVNIKEICWNLNNIRLRDCEMGAIVNRDLSRRVRPVNGVTAHKQIVRSDIKLCAKIALNLDDKFGLWHEQNKQNDVKRSNGENKIENFGFKSNNPVLQNITDYLIEEASAEEDELLGLTTGEHKDQTEGELLDRDPQLITVLDKLILYMRIVHSVDFYNHCEYPYEDEMPNRCGIIHARGPPPQNKVTSTDVQDYIKNFEGKMSSFLAKSTPIEEEELKNLGCKDAEAEVEKFIQANTQELAKDKWLCPLSGKKFKGPEFIRKHIFNKHGEKVDEVRKEVEYFNNYLKDPKRPQLPENPGNSKRPVADIPPPQVPYRPGYPGQSYGPPYPAYAPPMIGPHRARGFGARRGQGGGGGGDYRPIIHYRDLDAPREPVDYL